MNRNQAYDVFIATGADLTNKLYHTRTYHYYTHEYDMYILLLLYDDGGPRRAQIKPSHEDDR